MVVSRTPFRISFFGGGTDYPNWYREHGGAVLATTIDKYCYLSCRYLPPFFEHRIRVVYSKIELCQSLDEIQHPAVREVLRFLDCRRGLEVHHDGDLPARSGMGTSSSFTVGLLHAMHALRSEFVGKNQLMRESIHVEQDLLGEAVGSQDQVLAAFGGFNHVKFHTTGDITVHPVILPPERLAELQSHLMLFYTGIRRTAADVAATFIHKLHDRRRHLRIISDLVKEALSVLSGPGDLQQFGELMHEGWLAKQSLSDAVSNAAINGLYEEARAAGAVGGKLLGAGGGGFMVLFVPPERQDDVIEKLDKCLHVPFRFEFSGSQIVFYDQETDYAQAEAFRDSRPAIQFRELNDGPA